MNNVMDITPVWESIPFKDKLVLEDIDFGNRIAGLGSPTVESIKTTQNEVNTFGDQLDITGWTSTLKFSSFGMSTVTWTAGQIIMKDGTTFNIYSGNTPNMTGPSYIYFDKTVSTTNLQFTTVPAESVGLNRILIAVAQNNTVVGSQASFQVFGGAGGFMVTKDGIAAGTITGDRIASNTIDANKLTVAKLSAISADIGDITAGTITGVTITGGTLRTSSGNTRVEMRSSDNSIHHYYNGVLRTVLANGELSFYRADGTASGAIYGMTTSLDIVSGNSVRIQNNFVFDGSMFAPAPSTYCQIGNLSYPWDGVYTRYTTFKQPTESYGVYLESPYGLSNNVFLKLPKTVGNSGDVLTSNGYGEMSWTAGGGRIMRGRVDSGGTLVFKSGMDPTDSALQMSAGVYRVFHTMGTTNYSVVCTAYASTVKNITVSYIDSYYFEVRIANLNDVLENNAFSFIMAA